MSLADLRALARSWTAPHAPGTPGTPALQARGSKVGSLKMAYFCGLQGDGPPGTRDFDDVGESERTAPGSSPLRFPPEPAAPVDAYLDPDVLAEREAVANEPEPASRTVRACCYCFESGDGCDTCGDEPEPDRTPQPPPDERLEEAATTDFKKVSL